MTDSKIITVVDNDGECSPKCFFWDATQERCRLNLIKYPSPPCETDGSGKYKLTWEKVDEVTEQVIDDAIPD